MRSFLTSLIFPTVIIGLTLFTVQVIAANNTENAQTPTGIMTELIESQVDINHASIEELMTLEKVGRARAIAIIDYRTINGQFNQIEDLVKVKGIGQKILTENQHKIVVTH